MIYLLWARALRICLRSVSSFVVVCIIVRLMFMSCSIMVYVWAIADVWRVSSVVEWCFVS